MIPNGGVCVCVRLEGMMGYGNPPVPETSPSLNSDTLSTQPLCGEQPPGSVLVPFPISGRNFFLSMSEENGCIKITLCGLKYAVTLALHAYMIVEPLVSNPFRYICYYNSLHSCFCSFIQDFGNLAAGVPIQPQELK